MAKRKKNHAPEPTTPAVAASTEPVEQGEVLTEQAEEQTLPVKKTRGKKAKTSPACVETTAETDGAEAAAQTSETADPYEPYRYRWEAGQVLPRRVDWKRLSLFCVSIILALGLVALSLLSFFELTQKEEEDAPVEAPEGAIVLESVAPKSPEDALSVGEMISAVKDAVVGIDVVRKDTTPGVASGLIVDGHGYIVTNRHVIENAATITVHTADGESYVASVLGTDELSDIAVLRIKKSDGGYFTRAILGDSSQVQQGDWVVAIGTPGGLEFSCSATMGIVSGTDRKVQMQSADGGASKTYTVIQTDASINPGNSGGPLVNVYGQVIGINSLKLSDDSYESIGFALPINGVIDVVNQIIWTGRVTERPEQDFVTGGAVFGATFEYFSAFDAQESGLVPGAYVKTVAEDGPAKQAGVRMGDILTEIDGASIRALSDVSSALSAHRAGDSIEVTLYRDHESITLTVTLAAYTSAQ